MMTPSRYPTHLTAAALLLVGSACGVSTEQGKQMDDRMRRIEAAESATAGQLDQQRTVFRERISAVDQKLGEVQQKLDELNATASRSGADVAAAQDRLAERVKKLQAMLEDQQRRQDDLESSLALLRAEAEPRTRSTNRSAKAAAGPPRVVGEQAAFLEKARAEERAGHKVVAGELYAEFVRKWPTDPQTPEALYRVGEIAFGEKRYQDSLSAFGRVAESYPKSEKAPDALLGTAESMTLLGMKQDARAIYEAVGSRYPGSAAAKKAAGRLREIYPKDGKG
jgi:tol-pal system protein YbgF